MGGPENTDVLAACLEHGADPNIHCTASNFGVPCSCPSRIHQGHPDTPWTLFLNWRFQHWHSSPKTYLSSWSAASAELFLKAGASTTAQFKTRGRIVETMPVPEILEVLLPGDKFKALRSKYFPRAERRWWLVWVKLSQAWLQCSVVGKISYPQRASSFPRRLGILMLFSVAIYLPTFRFIRVPLYLRFAWQPCLVISPPLYGSS